MLLCFAGLAIFLMMTRPLISFSSVHDTIGKSTNTKSAFFMSHLIYSAHNIDSRSLSRLGVYVSRANISKVFVNSAGTIPPSNAIYGMNSLHVRVHTVFYIYDTSTG